MDMSEPTKNVCLTIAGLDPSGGAGVIADIKAFTAFGCFAAAAVTSITYQNTTGVFGAEAQSAETVERQIRPIFDDYIVSAAKTGMLPTREVIETVASLIEQNEVSHFVVDPVVRSTSGFDLIDNSALRALIERLFPLATVITPNIPEAERISGVSIESYDDIVAAAEVMRELGAKNVLIKGGHGIEGERKKEKGKSEGKLAIDYFFSGDGIMEFSAPFVNTRGTHGTGCVLSAAIAANLANGLSLNDAISAAKKFVNDALRLPNNLGQGFHPVNI